MSKKLFAILLALVIATPFYGVLAGENERNRTTSSYEQNDDGEEEGDEESDAEEDGDDEGDDEDEAEVKDDKDSRNQNRQQRIEEGKIARAEKKCEGVQKRVQNKVKEMQNNLNMYIHVHDRTIQRLKRLSDVLSKKGLDTANLNSYINTLEIKMNNLETTYQGFIDELKGSGELACSDTKEGFKARLETARSNARSIKALRNEIRTYISGTIKPELMRLRQLLEDGDEQDQEGEEDENEIKTIKFTDLTNPGTCLNAKSQCNTCSRNTLEETFACTMVSCENEVYKCTKYLGDDDEQEQEDENNETETEVEKD